MRSLYLFIALLLLASCTVLTSCTGTPTDVDPLFVIAGVQDTGGANPSILVLQDRIFEPELASGPRFAVFASQPLEAPVVAFATVTETSTPDELIVLSRSGTAGTVRGFLDFFNTRALTEGQADTFSTLRPRIDLSTLITSNLCPIDVQVTRSGDYAVIFNSPSVCNINNAQDSIVTLSLSTTAGSVVSTILSNDSPANPLVRGPVFSNGISQGGMYLDQSSDVLYILRRSVSNIILKRLESSTYIEEDPETNTDNGPDISNNIPISNEDFRDMTKVGSELVLLGTNTYVAAPLSFTEDFAPEPVTTLSIQAQDARAFVPDPSTTRLFILDNDRLVYHADITETENTELELTAISSTINTKDSYLYMAGTNYLGILDVLSLSETTTDLSPLFTEETCDATEKADPNTSNGLCRLNNPTVLSWATGILLPEE
ncbi:MAG: hypothetical protein ACRCYY_13305 [Trueperaceae bacterium]